MTAATVGIATPIATCWFLLSVLLLLLSLFAEVCDGRGRTDGIDEAVVDESAVGVTRLSCTWPFALIL